MTVEDPNLASWERGERIRNIIGAVLVAAVLNLSIVVGVLGLKIGEQNRLAQRVESSERRSLCIAEINSEVLVSFALLVTDQANREAALTRMTAARDRLHDIEVSCPGG